MAKVALTVAVFLTLFASSFAYFGRFHSHLHLPSSSLVIDRDRLESDAVESNPQIASRKSEEDVIESKIDEPDSSLPDLNTQPELHSIPVTVITFRPVNRHFLPFPFHHTRHHHPGFHRVMKPWLPYGNDMILSGENRGFESRPMRGGDHRMPEEWISLDQYPHPHPHHHNHHHEDGRPRFPYMHHDGSMMNGGKEWEDRVEQNGASPMKGFRKFLHQFGF